MIDHMRHMCFRDRDKRMPQVMSFELMCFADPFVTSLCAQETSRRSHSSPIRLCGMACAWDVS